MSKKKNIVLTGALGQDGLILSKILLKNGYNVVGIVKNINFRNWILLLKPTKQATAPSNEPCGRPMKKINKKEIIFKIVRSANILFK